MKFFSVFLAIFLIFTFMQATSCGLVDATVKLLNGKESGNDGKGTSKGCDSGSKGKSLINADVEALNNL
ncbi:unnamed protein product [Acanthoscelides obtectus]|uniref:Uncharacterized protein n=1 Tax=Acanthoscelides obtectus TaxID=200917 RepID=A0A9P0L1X6_ACAOB|nr:unnamed protein product [Acanthoscelides obtectus]CAK1622220.1 hypothetical protein AOBTE_LOCUS1379 [Acanthoscelides obtectus]